MKLMFCGCLIVSAAALSGAPVVAEQPVTAKAAFVDLNGRSVGQASLTQMVHGVRIRLELTGLPPGWHGFHVHETALCEPPFASAGQHVNPDGESHGFDSEGLHAGDLPNVFVTDDGTAQVEFVSPRIALVDDKPTDVGLLDRAIGAVQDVAGRRAHNILAGTGASLMIHAAADDYKSDPAGESGERIACGVIQRG